MNKPSCCGEVVESEAFGKTFFYCRGCKQEAVSLLKSGRGFVLGSFEAEDPELAKAYSEIHTKLLKDIQTLCAVDTENPLSDPTEAPETDVCGNCLSEDCWCYD